MAILSVIKLNHQFRQEWLRVGWLESVMRSCGQAAPVNCGA